MAGYRTKVVHREADNGSCIRSTKVRPFNTITFDVPATC